MNSAYAATHVAAHAGAAKVLLCGVDMGGTNWHGRHPPQLRTTQPHGYTRMIECWETLAPELASRGVEVINCAPTSALGCFTKRPIEDALR